MREKRTEIDWSKHKLSISCIEGNEAIYDLSIPGTRMKSIIFINIKGIMAVTGDYGNWIFCREFHPSADNYVSDSYWIQKLKIASCQDPYEFDSNEAKKQIIDLKKQHEFSEKEIEWLDALAKEADQGEYAFIARAMDKPSSFDWEMIPNGKVLLTWLLIVFDAFDEICKRR